jgi:hypothetical protein
MSASSFGGVRASGASRFAPRQYQGGVGVFGGISGPSGDYGGPAGPTSRGSRQTAAMPVGSPYSAAPTRNMASLSTHHTLLLLVAAEVLVLVGLRSGFKHHHGG